MKHTIVLSDFHLSLAQPEEDVWMKFRQRRFFIDGEFGQLVDALISRTAGAPFEVVFNGDTFELDGASSYAGLNGCPDADVGSEASEALVMGRILGDHPGFVQAVARLLLHAERVVFVSGNHDLGLYWPAVRQVLTHHLLESAQQAGAPVSRRVLGTRLIFRQWFHRTGDGVYIEHGQQYDPASAAPDPLIAARKDGRGLWLSLGSAGYRHLLGGIGTMNPHVPKSFILGGVGYLKHYSRYYLGRGRSLVRTWLRGALRSARHMLGQRAAESEPGPAQRLDAVLAQGKAAGLSPATVRQLRDLQRRPVSDRPMDVLRELWLDRVALGAVALFGGALALLLLSWPTALAVVALLMTGYLAYERLAPPSDLDGYEAGLGSLALRISRLTGDPVVVLGHTHKARRLPLAAGATLINTGSWAPAFEDPECTRPVHSERTLAWIRSDGRRVRHAQLLAWQGARLTALGAPREAAGAAHLEDTPTAHPLAA